MTAFKRIVFCILFLGSFIFLIIPINPGFSRWNLLCPMAIMWLLSSLAVPGRHVPIIARIVAFPTFVGLIIQGISELRTGKLQLEFSDAGHLILYFVYLWMSGFVIWKGRLPNTSV